MSRERERRPSPRVQQAIGELEDLIREHFPTAQFQLRRAEDDPRSLNLVTTVEEETLERLREIARDKGIGPTTLARMWILEHLHQEHTTPEASSLSNRPH